MAGKGSGEATHAAHAMDTVPMRVFLTGGSGLLGWHLATHLREVGHEVTALVRPHADARFLSTLGCRVIEGDVRSTPDTLSPLMDGCTHVVHAAARVYTGGTWPEIREVNVDGTGNVLAAAAAAGIAHATHLSSVTVYGTVSGPVDESSPIGTDLPVSDLYARSKREAEKVARSVEASTGLGVTVLRPAALYGERDRTVAVRVARTLRRGIAFTLGSGRNTIPVVYAGNLAVAIRLALEAGRGKTTYDVGFDHPVTQRMFLEGIARGMGRTPRLVPLPATLVRGGALVLEALGLSAPGMERLPLGRVARLAVGENPYRSRRLRDELGWEPPHPAAAALERTGRWLRENGS